MKIAYSDKKIFTQRQVESLFLSVQWVSGQYPRPLYKALQNSPTVFTAWDGDRLVGLVRAIDDGVMLAYMHYVLVHPDYQGRGIAGKLVRMVQEKYKDYLYVELMPEESRNAAFYQRFGFQVMEDGIAMLAVNKEFGKEALE